MYSEGRRFPTGLTLAAVIAAVGWTVAFLVFDFRSVGVHAPLAELLSYVTLVTFAGPPMVGFYCGLRLGAYGLAGAVLGQIMGVFAGAFIGDPVALALDPRAEGALHTAAHGFLGLALFAGGFLIAFVTMGVGALIGWVISRSSRSRQPDERL